MTIIIEHNLLFKQSFLQILILGISLPIVYFIKKIVRFLSHVHVIFLLYFIHFYLRKVAHSANFKSKECRASGAERFVEYIIVVWAKIFLFLFHKHIYKFYTQISKIYLSLISHVYSIWSVEPNNLAGTEFCGMLYHNGRFADMPCNTLAPYVCQTQQMGELNSLSSHIVI